MLRIAYCQISAHPAYCGPNGSYIKEPIYDEKGPILNCLSEVQSIYGLTKQIEDLYLAGFLRKLQQILHSLKGCGIDLLVFPEYTIPAPCLSILYEFSQKEDCICIAASHTVQRAFEEIYQSINMDIPVDSCLNMSCCPVMIPEKGTYFFFKQHKSKWESNMEAEIYPDCDNSGRFTLEVKGNRVTVLLCIDALHIDVDKSNTDILIVPAASPTDGTFRNKFESYLSKDIPTVFCNFCDYGNSTVYCQLPNGRNIPYSDKTHITKASKGEEFVAVVDLEKQFQAVKVHTINTDIPINVVGVEPILYRDHNARQHDWLRLKDLCEQRIFVGMEDSINLQVEAEGGIIQQKKKYLLSGIREQTLSFDDIQAETKFVYINDYTLLQYEVNWLEKIVNALTTDITGNRINVAKALEPFSRLSGALQNLLPKITEKVNLPVFDATEQVNSVFQNRGGEIQQFRNTQQNRYKTVFVVQGFSQIGKSAFVNRVSSLYSFNLVDCPIPKGGSFESLLRGVSKLTGFPMNWEEIDEQTVRDYAKQFAHYLRNLNKSIVVLRTTANLFHAYNLEKSTLFFCCVAEQLYESKTGIKLIIENSRTLPSNIAVHPYIEICRLKPIYDIYIGRLIEQTANNITYSLSLPEIDSKIIHKCGGNPAVARMVGICLGQKINRGESGEISQEELDAFKDQYVKGIFSVLNVKPNEEEFLTEASIYRLGVPRKAFMVLPHYSDQAFDSLRDKLLLEADQDWFFVNSLISEILRRTATKDNNLHTIAATYFDEEYQENPSSVAKAEYLYHISFSKANLSVNENLKYYADDILSAAIELINNGEIDIAYSHLKLIRYYNQFCNRVEFNFYYSLCHIVDADYQGYRDLFDKAISESGQKAVLYCRMIRRLIGLRILNEAETLLNEAEEMYPALRELKALRILLLYYTRQTRDQALTMARELTRNSNGDFYSARILVQIYWKEDMEQEALKEIADVLKNWPNNRWAQRMQRILTEGRLEDQDYGFYDEDDME